MRSFGIRGDVEFEIHKSYTLKLSNVETTKNKSDGELKIRTTSWKFGHHQRLTELVIGLGQENFTRSP